MVRIGGTGETPEMNNKNKSTKGSAKQTQKSSVFNNPPSSYKVQDQDNFFKIAKKFGLTVYELAEANGWKYEPKTQTVKDAKGKVVSLVKGKEIKLTKPAKSGKKEATTPVAQNPTKHTVKGGEAPFTIADKYQVSIRQLAAENGWDVRVIRRKGEDVLEVFSNGKEVSLNKGMELKIPASVVKNIGTVRNISELKKKSGMTDGQFEIFEKFEGKPDNNFKPYLKAEKDAKGTWTIGYGYTKGVKKGDVWKLEDCYKQLAKDYVQTQEDIRVELGDETFNKMPKSLKEGLIDLVFNKGFEAIDIPKFKKAIENDDMKSALSQLIYTKSMVDDKEMNGLYKRSLARIAHVYNGLSLEDKAGLKPVIDKFYKVCKEKVSTVELNKWWNPSEGVTDGVKEDKAQVDKSKAEYIVQKGDSSLAFISRKLGTSLQQLMVLNRHLAPDYKIKIGDKININAQSVVDVPQNIKTDKNFSEEIVNIKNMDLDSQERLQKTNTLIDTYAKKFNLSKQAIDLLKAEAKKEYESWFWVNTDKMTAMTDILEAGDAKTLYEALYEAIDESDEAKMFAKEVLASKITKDNVAELITLAGGSKKFIKMMKKVGGFDILKHSLVCLTDGAKDQQNLLIQYNKAVKEESYSEVQRVFDNILATSAKEISDNLDNTLVDDDDLNSILYKYQIQRVTSENIIEVMRSNDIIAGICEADNERSVCKEEIKKLFDVLDKNYDLDDDARENFLKVFEEQFRERSVWNPSTWWIGTGEVSDAFKNLLVGDLKPVNLRTAICKKMGWTPEDLAPPSTFTKGKVSAYKESFQPTGSGSLDGKRIVVNAGHGWYNPNTKQFDPGALGVEGSDVNEWMVSRFISQKVIEQLQSQGAEVVLVAGHWETVAYKDYGADMFVSIHGDERDKGASVGPKIYAFKGDKDDEKLASKVLDNFVNSDFVVEAKDLNFKPKDGKSYSLLTQLDDQPIDSMRASMIYDTHYVLQGERKKASKEPAILMEVCDMNNLKDLRNIVLGKYGDDVVKSIVKGIVDYWD